MVRIRGKRIDPWHVVLTEPVPVGAQSIEVRLQPSNADADPRSSVELLTRNPSFNFLRDEPDLYG